MSFLRSTPQANTPAVTPQYTGLQIQTSSSAVPIALVYGKTKTAPNFFWTGAFTTIAQYSTSSSGGGGKGGGGGSTSTLSGYNYQTAIMMGLCEGPIAGIGAVWNGQSVYAIGDLGLNLFNGATPQAVWSYLTSAFPSQALNYNGLAYLASPDFALGSSASLPSLGMEVAGVFALSGANGQDADPAEVILDFLTNPQYGVGFPSASIAMATLIGASGDGSYQSYCKALGLCFSPALTDQESADSVLTRWLQITNTAAFWSEGLLKFVPYGDVAVTGPLLSGGNVTYSISGTTSVATTAPVTQIGTCSFVPNVTPLYALTDDDIVTADADADPITVARTDPYAAYNEQVLEIYQRTNFYDATPITAFDQNAIELYGLRIASTVTAHEICDPAVGQTAAQLILQRGLYIRNTYTFKLSWEFCLLEPMDLVTLTDPAIGLNNTAVRITTIEEDDDGLLTVTAEEFPGGVATAVAYPVQHKASSATAANAGAGAVNAPILFEPPYELAGDLEIWAAVSGVAVGTWGGANVYMSADGTTYTYAGTISGPSRMGVTTADLPAMVGGVVAANGMIDSTNTLAVDLTESGGTLSPASQSDLLAGNTACYVGGANGAEIVAYQNAAVTGVDRFGLSPLLRGAFDTVIVDHPIGSPFARLDAGVFKYPYKPSDIGSLIYLKFQSFNTLGGGLQDLSDCGAYPYRITGSPLAAPLAAPTNLRTVFTAGFEQLAWDEVTDFRSGIRYQILKGDTPVGAQQVGDQAHPPFTLMGAGTYYVVAYCQPTPGLTVMSPVSASIIIAGNMLVANALRSWNQQTEGWQGTLTNLSVQGTAPNQYLTLGAGQTAGTYQAPASDIVDLGYVGVLALNVTWKVAGSPVGQNILTVPDVLAQTDILGSASSSFVTAWPEVQIGTPGTADLFASTDVFDTPDVFGSPNIIWGTWQKFLPGNYQGRYAQFRMQVQCSNPSQVNTSLLAFSIQSSANNRIDHYQARSIPTGGLTITFTPDGASGPAPFNGGPNGAALPYVNVTMSTPQAGDVLSISSLTASSVVIQVLNGASGVARTGVNVDVQGY